MDDIKLQGAATTNNTTYAGTGFSYGSLVEFFVQPKKTP